MLTVSAVLYLTLFPRPLPDNDLQLWEHTDKIVHALMMFGVYCALALDLRRQLSLRVRLWLLIGVIAFGGAIELIQNAMGLGRSGDLIDFAADCAGALLAFLTAKSLLPRQRSQRSN